MISPVRLLLLGSVVLAGCSAARNLAVSTFRVVDAPARYVRDRLDPPETIATTTTQTVETTSDVANPGRPVTRPTPRPSRTDRSSASARSSSAAPRPAAPQAPQFPVAKPVPGRPGYVYSVDPKGGIVDVTGYKSGDKAKDPYTQRIFIVP